MRQIKFRVWDESRKKMHAGNPKFVEFKINSQGELSASNYNPKYELQMMPIMQFTGLKDVNGVEIYEGDIVNWRGAVCYISWEKSDASFMAVEQYDSWAESGQEWADSCAVIGNIYQNPELLK